MPSDDELRSQDPDRPESAADDDEADAEELRPDEDTTEDRSHEGGKGEGRKTNVDRNPEDQRSDPDPKERSSAV